MKKLILFLMLCNVFNTSYCQEDVEKRLSYSIRIEPIKLLDLTLFIIGEKQISENSSIEFSPLIIYGSKNSSFVKDLAIAKPDWENGIHTIYGDNNLMGVGLYAGYKYYLENQKSKIQGAYISGKGIFKRVTISTFEKSWKYSNYITTILSEGIKRYNLNTLFLSVDFGYKLILGSKFCVDIYCGGGIKFSKYDHHCITKYRKYGSYDYSGIMMSIGGSIGFTK